MFLSIDGNEYDVIAMTEAPELGGGESIRAYLGGLRSTYSWQRRTFDITLNEMDEADYVTLYNSIVLGAQVPLDEDAISGGPLTCELVIKSAAFIRAKTGYKRLVTLAARQV